ncbi:MAG TPA: TolC family protein [Candidatus Acidoferrum sp.]|nr:TolC family protein [Candidatus Acidoferrum sp.]
MKELFARPLLAVLLAALLVIAPVLPAFAQQPTQYPTPQAAPPVQTQTSNPAPLAPPIPVSLGVSKYDFSNGPHVFPNLLNAYKPIKVDQVVLVNSPRLEQLVHDGKLELTLQDAVELALENNLDIVVQRYIPWLADTAVLKAKTGQFPGNIPTNAIAIPGSQANLPFLNFDPVLTQQGTIVSASTPVNNPFLSGTGTSGNGGFGPNLIPLKSHSTIFNTGYAQSFTTGTTLQAAWDNTRSSSTAANFFNPTVQGSLALTISQNLLAGCCWKVNHRQLYIAKNNRKIADLVFAQQAITTVTAAITDYWELVYARENVKVQQQAVAVSDKLYNDNKKQLEIGTLAPLDVTRAEAQLASDRQNLIVAQTAQLQAEQTLKNAIAKDPLAPSIINVEIIPTELPLKPEAIEAPTFEEAVKEAFAKRPDLQEQVFNLQNGQIELEATANALRPALTFSAQYTSSGLAGNTFIPGTTVTTAGAPIVDANGNVVPGLFEPAFVTPPNGLFQSGFTTAQNQIFHNRFPTYVASLNLQLPLRNRSNQADSARAILQQRQLEAQVQQLRNAALLDVRNTYIALQQDRARVDAASKARQLQQETFDAEQKKYQLGASTVYNVILTQRDLVAAAGTELRALADLVEAKANYERAVGRTLEVNRVSIAKDGSSAPQIERDTLIPGTLDGKVVGTDELFKKLDGQR